MESAEYVQNETLFNGTKRAACSKLANSFCKSLFEEEPEGPCQNEHLWSNMCNINGENAGNLFGMQQKCFRFEAVGRKSAPDVILCRQVLPAVIQMTAPPHRQWARTNTYPGEAGTLNFQCNLHALVGVIPEPSDETDTVFLLLFVVVKHCWF